MAIVIISLLLYIQYVMLLPKNTYREQVCADCVAFLPNHTVIAATLYWSSVGVSNLKEGQGSAR